MTAESKSGEINTFVVDTVKVLGAKANTVKLGNAHMLFGIRKDRIFMLQLPKKRE